MTRVALRSLLGRKLRASLTAIAIVLGVAMVSGTYVLTDTINAAFSQIFSEAYAGTDVVVTGKGADINFQGLSTEDPPFPESVLEDVRGVDGVALAAPQVFDALNTKILDKNGKAINTQGSPSFGFGFNSGPEYSRFNPLRLQAGTWPHGPNEVLIDAGTAEKQGFEVGDTIRVATTQPVQSFTLAGIANYGELQSLGTATFAVWDLPTAQKLLDREGLLDTISVAGVEGTSPDELVRDIAPVLPDSAKVTSADVQQAEDEDEVSEFLQFIRYFLLAFAGIALFVGAFVIFNTLSITVAQRTREFATLRTLGASRRQVLVSVIVEAFIVGLLASIVGLVVGLGLAQGLQALFEALDLDLPRADTVFATRTVVVSLLIGTLITLLSGIFPAIRATRVPPIAAVREGATLPKSRFSRFTPYIAILVIILSLLAISRAMFADDIDTAQRLLLIAAGILALFIGVALFSSRVVRPIAAVTAPVVRWLLLAISVLVAPLSFSAWLIRRGILGRESAGKRVLCFFGGFFGAIASGALIAGIGFALSSTGLSWLELFGMPIQMVGAIGGAYVAIILPIVCIFREGFSRTGEHIIDRPDVTVPSSIPALARENARRNPGRTAATSAALMIGLALVTTVAVLAHGMKASNRGAIEDQVHADYIITAQDGFTPFVKGIGDAAAAAPVSETATSVRSDVAEVDGHGAYLTGIDPDKITAVYQFDWEEGSDQTVKSLGPDEGILDTKFAEDHDIALGDTVKVLVASGATVPVKVTGLYRPPPFYPLLGTISVPTASYDKLYDRPRNQYTFVNVAGEPTDATTEQLEQALSGFPDGKVQTREGWIDQQDEDFNQFLTMLYVLLALAVIVSLFGMVNTLALSIFERTREIGMLRAVGMTRPQLKHMIRHESVITALIGAVLGLPLGILLAALVTRALSQFDVRYEIPGEQLVQFTIVAVVVGIAAAMAPARRAGRLNVLDALHYE